VNPEPIELFDPKNPNPNKKNHSKNQRFASEFTTSVNRSKSSRFYNISARKTRENERFKHAEAKAQGSR